MTDIERDLGNAHLAGFLHHPSETDGAVVARIGQHLAADANASGAGIDQRIGRVAAALQGRHEGQRLDDRAGLENVGQRAVARATAAQRGAHRRAIIGIEMRVADAGQQFTRVAVQGHDNPRLGAGQRHRAAQFRMQEILQTQIDGELQIAPRPRRLHDADVAHGVAAQIFEIAPAAGPTAQPSVVGQFQAGHAATVQIGHAYKLRSHFAGGIEAPVLALGTHARHAKGQYFPRPLGRQMAAQIHVPAVGIAPHTLRKFVGRKVQPAREFLQARVDRQFARVSRKGDNRRGNRQGLAAPIGDQSPIRRQLDAAHRALGALALQELRAAIHIQHLK